jgi:uncharacterized lipoprotein
MKKRALVLGAIATLSLAACSKSQEVQNTQVDDITANEAPLNDSFAATPDNVGDNVLANDIAVNTIGPIDNAH